jgi:hypothetical protein
MTDSGLSAEDTIALHQLVHQYAHIVDDADIEFDTSAFGNAPVRGIGPVIQSYVNARHPVAHHVTTPVVTTEPDGTVRVRSKVLSLLGGGLCGSGTYDDVAVKTTEGWRISKRVIGLRRERDLKRPPPRPAG